MACPRCGCRMLSKAGSGSSRGLICSDCGLQLVSGRLPKAHLSSRSQLITIGLISLFGLTAAGLMTIKDQNAADLLNGAAPLNLEERRSGQSKSHRFNSVLPRASSLPD